MLYVTVPVPGKLPLTDDPVAGHVALKGFFAIADAWGLTPAEQRVLLGGIGKITYRKYRKLPKIKLSADTLERISYVMGIRKALKFLFGVNARADEWIKKPYHAHPFNGLSALEVMLGGYVADVAFVRQFLDAQRGADAAHFCNKSGNLNLCIC
jgi:hypothetical protein